MNHARNFLMTWVEWKTAVECEQMDPVNQWVYDWWLDRFPIRYVQSHVALTGAVINAMNVLLPETQPSPGDRKLHTIRFPDAKPGWGKFSYNARGGLSGGRLGAVAVVYGRVLEDMNNYFCFKVVDRDLPTLLQIGPRVWQELCTTKQIVTVELRVKQ
jgi:hypothetical protein